MSELSQNITENGKLLPCPSCSARVGSLYDTEAEAIAAWNTRTEYHGYEQAAIEAWESIKKWNTRAERTCHIVEKQKELQDNVLVRDYTFSCGHIICWAHTYEPRYCPNCGARVVEQ